MKHIVPFPFPENPENFLARDDLRRKLLAGRIIKELPSGHTSIARWAQHPCWRYAGKWTDGRGYKKIKFKGHVIYVHRASVELFRGPIPDGHLVDHLCRDRGCWQPAHLEPVPTKVNIERGDNPNWMMRNAVKDATVTGRHPAMQDPIAMGPVLASAEKHALIAADLAEVEARVLAHYNAHTIHGKIGGQDVVVETPRPEFWSTPSLFQAHLDHGHPRFRAPLGALDDVNLVDTARYTFPDAPVAPTRDLVFDDTELAPRPLWLRVVRFLKRLGARAA